jgi:hypothetical protein
MSAGPLVALQAFSSVMGAVENFQAARAEARTLNENARRTDLDGAIQGQEMRRESRAAIGEQLAAGAASGVAIGTGSALDLIGESAQEAEFEILNLRRQAADQSANLRYQAKVTRRGATAALFRDLINTGSQAASGLSGAGDAAAISAARARERASVLPRESGTGIPLPGRNSIVQPQPGEPRRSPWVMNYRGPR